MFFAIEPFDGSRQDIHTAMSMALLANINRDGKKHPEPITPDDFLPDWWQERQTEHTGPSLAAKFRMISETINAQNAKEIKKHGESDRDTSDQADR